MPEFIVGKPLPKHDLYDRQTRARSFWCRSYHSEFDFPAGKDAAGHDILPKHERETEERFRVRMAMAMSRRYAKSIIDRYNDHATRGDVDRPKVADGSPYGQLCDDATDSGTPLATLMRRALRWSQVEGASFLLADQSVAGSFETAAGESAAGKRGLLRLIRADQVLWWRDWMGQVDAALILFLDRDGNPFAWYVTATELQRIDYQIDKTTTKITAIYPPQPHTYGGCPLVRCAPEFDDSDLMPATDSQCAPLAASQRRVLNIDSWHLEELAGATFTTQVFLGVAPDQLKEANIGPGLGLAVPGGVGGSPSLGKIGADPAQATSLREAIDLEVRELYRIAGLAPGNPTETGAPESGVARAFAFNEVEAKLSALADAAEAAENLAVKRLAAGSGWPYPGDTKWPDSFGAPDLGDELEFVIRTITSPLPDVLKNSQVRDYAESAFDLSPEETAELETQLAAGLTPPSDPFAKSDTALPVAPKIRPIVSKPDPAVVVT